jgi:hypothetical protein
MMKQDDRQMGEMLYTKLTEVTGRAMADVLESYLRSEEIDVVLIEEAVHHVTHTFAFAPVDVYVPKASIQRARELLKKFNESPEDEEEEGSV